MGGYSSDTSTVWGSANAWGERSWDEGPEGWVLPGCANTGSWIWPQDSRGMGWR